MDAPRLFLRYFYPPAHYPRRLPTNDELIDADIRRDFARHEAGFVARTAFTGPAPHELFHQNRALSGAPRPPEEWTGKVVEAEG
ncbi:MAG: hypothetical protein AB1916_09045 [Thermodesulfobacteriota bacterium]